MQWLEKLCSALSENRRKCCKDCSLLLLIADPLQSEPLYCQKHNDSGNVLDTCAEMEFSVIRACASSKSANYTFKLMRFINEIQTATKKSTVYQPAGLSASASDLLSKAPVPGAKAAASSTTSNSTSSAQGGVTYRYRDFANLETAQLLSDSPVRAMSLEQIEALKKTLERSICDTSDETLPPASEKRPSLTPQTSFDLPAVALRSSMALSKDSDTSASTPKTLRLGSSSSTNEHIAPLELPSPSQPASHLNESPQMSPRRSSSSSSCLYSPNGGFAQSQSQNQSPVASPKLLRQNSAASSASNRSPVHVPAQNALDSPFSPPPQNRGAHLNEREHHRRHRHHNDPRANAENSADRVLLDQLKLRVSSLVKSRLSPFYYHDIRSTDLNPEARVSFDLCSLQW